MPSTHSPTIPMSTPTADVPVVTLPLNVPAPLLGDLYRMTVNEYERLAAADVLDDRKVELIGGYLVRKMTTKPPHVWAVDAAREVSGSDSFRTAGTFARKSPCVSPTSMSPSPTWRSSGMRDDYTAVIPAQATSTF